MKVIIVWEILNQDHEKNEVSLMGWNWYKSMKEFIKDKDNLPQEHLIQIGDSVYDFGFTGWF